MKNLLIVESKNDKFFIEALIHHLNLESVEVASGVICGIDDFECLGGLSEKKLTETLIAIKGRIKKDDESIQKVGIIIDIDEKTKIERLNLVNNALSQAFNTQKAIDDINTFVNIPIDALQDIEIAVYFTNLDGKGELETVLKQIKTKDSVYADCLQSWQDCLRRNNINQGNGLKNKDFDKFWVNVYIRYDTCTKEEQKQAERKCGNEAAMKKPIWDFNHSCLTTLKEFLKLFNV